MPQRSRVSVTVSLLKSYYTSVQPLQSYLSTILDPVDGHHTFLARDDDPPIYLSLLTESYVTSATDHIRRVRAVSPMVPIREIIDKAQEKLFHKSKGRPSNVITTGYRSAARNGERGKIGMSRMALTNHFVNTNVTALQAPEWELLFERIGEDAMYQILTETSVFVSLPNDCLCQLIGDPIIHLRPPMPLSLVGGQHKEAMIQDASGIASVDALKRKLTESHPDEHPLKRMKSRSSASSISSVSTPAASTDPKTENVTQRRKPSDISLVRSRMFYSWARHIPDTNAIALGLPPKHVLNRMMPSDHSKLKVQAAEWIDPNPLKQEANARHLSKYVFPRQYGLSNPFVIPRQQDFSLQLSDYSDRETEIDQHGTSKTPKRVKPVVSILDKMVWMHGKCAYKALLEQACPSKLKTESKEPLDSSVILEMMSEYSIQLRSQPTLTDANASVDSSGHPIIPHGLSQAQKHRREKPRFAEFACSFSEVYRYVALVTDAVIPRALWGCEQNRKLVMQHVKTFISSRRYETTTLHNILQRFSVSECDWLMPGGSKQAAQTRVSVTDALKRRELLEEFIFWYFDSFVLPLLRTTFYVTESSALRRRVLYFRQDDWSMLCAPLVEKLSSDTFQKLEPHDAGEILRQRRLGYSFVRLLPKETGVRPIVNLRRRKAAGKGPFARPEPSINQILQAAFQVLTYEKENQAKLLGASIFGSNEIYPKLKAFKVRLTENGKHNTLPKLYFVKVDVQACFDTIDQTRLLGILKDLISEDTYMIQRFGQVGCAGSRVKRKYVKKARSEDDHPHFLDFAAQLAGALRSRIFVDQVVYPFANKEEVINLLEEHITENIVKIGQDYFRQVVGIPQGSVLSALLCSFFYGDLESRHLKFTQDPHSLLLRLIDDYLLITTSLPRARKFLDVMTEGHPEYGCFIAREKTRTNFDYGALMNVTDPHEKTFPWCGYMINMTDLSVSVDYSRYHETYLQDSLTVEVGRRPGVAFTHKMLQLAKSKSHIIFSDAQLNSEQTIYLNIYQNFMVLAMKMHHYLRYWGLDMQKSFVFIQNTIHQVIRYTFSAIRNKAGNELAKTHGGRCEVQEAEVTWLGTHAFHIVLSRKPRTYSRLLMKLHFELTLPRYRRMKKHFRPVVKEGLETLQLLAF